jgi:hypothetical protein
MTLLVPVLVLAILVLGWIAWLAFGPRSTPIVPSYLLSDHPRDAFDRTTQSNGFDSVPSSTIVDETEHLRDRLHASNSTASHLMGNAMHLELRPTQHSYGNAGGQGNDRNRAEV